MTDDFLDTGSSREEQRVKAVDYAKLYVYTFVDNPAGAELLKAWEERIVRKPTPINAPHTEYAAAEALRQFVNGIVQQIKVAQTEGR